MSGCWAPELRAPFWRRSLASPSHTPIFFGIGVEDGPAIADAYRTNFRPGPLLSEPKVNVGVQVLCADTEEEALRRAASRDLARLQSVRNQANGLPPVEEALSDPYLRNEAAFVQQYRQTCVDGDPQHVKEGLEAIAEAYQTADLSIVTICYDFADRVRSYELVAEACGIAREREP